jgi:hypothetical protein
MKKFWFILFLVVFSTSLFSQTKTETYYDHHGQQKQREINYKKDIDSIKVLADSTFKIGKDIVSTSKRHIKEFGLKDYIHSNAKIFFPTIVFFILFLLWLKGKTKI